MTDRQTVWICGLAFLAFMSVSADIRAEKVELDHLESKPDVWHLEPASSWIFEPASATQPAALVLDEVGKPKTKPVRRPYSYAIVKDHAWQQATFDLKVRSLEPLKKRGRDICIILGYKDDTHFTYVHLSNDADGRAHNIIMKVEGDSRRTIHEPLKPEARLTAEAWQDVRVRIDQDGNIEVFHVDMNDPLMKARDPDIVGKPLGVGSFNDRAAFTAIHLTDE